MHPNNNIGWIKQQPLTKLNPEWADAYYGLAQISQLQGEQQQYLAYTELYQKYKGDDQAKSKAINAARLKDAAADKAANQLVIYPLINQDHYMTLKKYSKLNGKMNYL